MTTSKLKEEIKKNRNTNTGYGEKIMRRKRINKTFRILKVISFCLLFYFYEAPLVTADDSC